MKSPETYKQIFDKYNGMMRTAQLQAENILYRPLHKLIEQGYVEKVRYGYYQWIDPEDFSEVNVITRLFPDAVLCMDT
ncbi:MAG: type IV toxin-antitoxin system AbiEi family antitoxin domain-containing protein, partial [Clostridia bacterium]|nr:type IV toxin-antitoxin system AbiEi family antitoxin domain-containing protein [Clostridia bacterium]